MNEVEKLANKIYELTENQQSELKETLRCNTNWFD